MSRERWFNITGVFISHFYCNNLTQVFAVFEQHTTSQSALCVYSVSMFKSCQLWFPYRVLLVHARQNFFMTKLEVAAAITEQTGTLLHCSHIFTSGLLFRGKFPHLHSASPEIVCRLKRWLHLKQQSGLRDSSHPKTWWFFLHQIPTVGGATEALFIEHFILGFLSGCNEDFSEIFRNV